MFSFLNRVYPNFRKIANAVTPNSNRPNAIKPIGNKFNNMPKATGANGKYTLNDARQKYQMQSDAINKGQVKLPNYVNVGDTSKMSPRMQQFLAEQQKRIAMDRLNKSTYQNELKNIKPDNNNLWRNPDGSYSYNSPITGKEHKLTKEDAKALNWDADQVSKIRNALSVNRGDPNVATFDSSAYDAYLKKQQQQSETNLPNQQANAAATLNSQVNQQPAVNNTTTQNNNQQPVANNATTQTDNQPAVNKYQDSSKYDLNNPAYQWQGNLGYTPEDAYGFRHQTIGLPNKRIDINGNEYYRYPDDSQFTNEQLEQQKQKNEQYNANLKLNLQKNLSKLDALIRSPNTTQSQKRKLLKKKQELKNRVQKHLYYNKDSNSAGLREAWKFWQI